MPVTPAAPEKVSDSDDDLDVGARIAAQLRQALDAASSADDRRAAAARELKAAEEEAERQKRLVAMRLERQKTLMEDFQKQSRDVSTDPALTPEERGHKLQQLAQELQAAMQQLGE